jgi:hypothetical protein
VAAEYTSAAVTQELTLWLMQLGASPDLLDLGLAVVHDELEHARRSHEICALAGPVEIPPISREQLALTRTADMPVEHDVVRVCVQSFCLGETLAVHLFSAMRSNASVPEVRDLLDKILDDEVRHRDFGWTLLDWMLQQDAALLSTAQKIAADEVERRRKNVTGMANNTSVGRDERAWGLLEGPRYLEIFERRFEPELVRRLEGLSPRPTAVAGGSAAPSTPTG